MRKKFIVRTIVALVIGSMILVIAIAAGKRSDITEVKKMTEVYSDVTVGENRCNIYSYTDELDVQTIYIKDIKDNKITIKNTDIETVTEECITLSNGERVYSTADGFIVYVHVEKAP